MTSKLTGTAAAAAVLTSGCITWHTRNQKTASNNCFIGTIAGLFAGSVVTIAGEMIKKIPCSLLTPWIVLGASAATSYAITNHIHRPPLHPQKYRHLRLL
jgi:hypothetical protein